MDTAQMLEWERVPLGQNKAALEEAASELINTQKTASFQCDESIELPVANVEEKRVEVRFAQGHSLERCTSRGTLLRDGTTPVRIKADFVDGLLARLEVVVPQEMLETLSDKIVLRFGDPRKAELTQDDLLAEPVEYRFWYPQKGVIWTLSSIHTQGSALVLQSLPLSRKLPPPGRAAKAGTPVSLDDLGFGSDEIDSTVLDELIRDSD